MKADRSALLFYLAFVTLAAALVYSYVKPSGDLTDVMRRALPGAVSFSRVGAGLFAGQNLAGEKAGYVAFDRAAGYDGDITTAVGIDTEGKISGVLIARHRDTPAFIQMLGSKKYFEQFRGKTVTDPFIIGEDIDAVSGATFSSQGVARAVSLASHAAARSQFGLEVADQPLAWQFGLKEALVLLLVGMAVLAAKTRHKILRWTVMVGSIAVIGFAYSSTVSLSNYAGLFMGNLPPLRSSLVWYLLIIGVPLLVLILGRNIHCLYLCPFGACQEVLAKVSGSKLKCGDPALERGLRSIKKVLTWLALLGAFLLASPGFAGYEPFAAMFALQGYGVQWFLLPAVLFTALFVPRFWCKYFCPVGVLQNMVVKLSSRLRRWRTRGKA